MKKNNLLTIPMFLLPCSYLLFTRTLKQKLKPLLIIVPCIVPSAVAVIVIMAFNLSKKQKVNT
jgi:ABC-type nitrate/sulfonate/bicarbonate transport system permease component